MPAGQLVQAVAPVAAEKEPAAQAAQPVPATAEKAPVRQLTQAARAVAPAAGENWPAGHAAQADAPVAAE